DALPISGCPIKFAGIGEKLDALEPFHPDRMADRILGMGDMMTLIEKAQAAFDAEEAARLQQKMRSADFSLEDFLDHLHQFKKLGPLDQVLGMIPGFSSMTRKLKDLKFDEKELVTAEAIINSMTPYERRNPDRIDGSRRRRVARGSGTSVQDVNKLLKQFEQTKKMLKQFSDWGKSAKKGGKRRFPKLPFM
ncbi:signal recognition particle protein, partial [Desulforudis sp. 1190]